VLTSFASRSNVEDLKKRPGGTGDDVVQLGVSAGDEEEDHEEEEAGHEADADAV